MIKEEKAKKPEEPFEFGDEEDEDDYKRLNRKRDG